MNSGKGGLYFLSTDDGIEDAAVVLVGDGGGSGSGSGSFFELYVVDGASRTVTEGQPLGDRIVDLVLDIQDGEVRANFTSRDGDVKAVGYRVTEGNLLGVDTTSDIDQPEDTNSTDLNDSALSSFPPQATKEFLDEMERQFLISDDGAGVEGPWAIALSLGDAKEAEGIEKAQSAGYAPYNPSGCQAQTIELFEGFDLGATLVTVIFESEADARSAVQAFGARGTAIAHVFPTQILCIDE